MDICAYLRPSADTRSSTLSRAFACFAVTFFFLFTIIPDLPAQTIEPVGAADSNPASVAHAAVEAVPASLTNTSAPSLPPLGRPDQDFGLAKASDIKPFSPWRAIGATMAMVGGLLAVNMWLRKRRLLPGRGGQNRHITLVERFFLDHRRSIMLFDVDGRRVLVGVGPDGMRKLSEYQEEEDSTAKHPSTALRAGAKDRETGRNPDSAEDDEVNEEGPKQGGSR